MTNDEAIEILQSGAGVWPITDRANNAINKAIKALSQQTEDAISRQAAIDAVAFGITYATGVNMETGEVSYPFAESNQELRKAIHRICELPLVTPKQIGWIPVSERLPSSGKTEDYLACCSDGYISTIMYDANNGRWLIDGTEVVAWMPLPEPYKAESEEQDADSD